MSVEDRSESRADLDGQVEEAKAPDLQKFPNSVLILLEMLGGGVSTQPWNRVCVCVCVCVFSLVHLNG